MSLLDYLRTDPACTNLAEGAVHTVAPMLADPDPTPVLTTLDAWAFTMAGRMPLPWSIHGAIDALNHFLFEEIGLQGNHRTHQDAAALALPLVIERRQGLPITLSILWIDLARRLGMDAVGVALPGHFVTGLRLDVGVLHFDAFHQGRALGQEDAERIVRKLTQGRIPFDASMLEPVANRTILFRLARNCYSRFLRTQDWEDALWNATHMIMLTPEAPDPYKDRAFVHLKRGDIAAALGDLQIADRWSPAEDTQVHEWIQRLQEGI